MDINSYIKNLIEHGNRLNIPGFGAFMRGDTDGSCIISFNQYLNFDDGVLKSAVSNGEGISETQAQELIAQYVARLNDQLNAAGSATIPGIGRFTKTDNVIEFVVSAATDTVSSDSAESDASGVESRGNVGTETAQPEQASANAASPTTQESNWAADANSSIDRSSAETAAEGMGEGVSPAPEMGQTPSAGGGNKNKLWIALVIVALLGLVAWLLLVYDQDNFVYKLFFGEKIEEVQPQEEDAYTAPDTVTVESEPIPEPVAPKETTPSGQYRYNIIVAAYTDKNAAQAKVNNLIEKGFERAYVLPQRIKGEMKYLAVIDASNNLRDAERRQEEILDKYKEQYAPNWITNGGE